MVLLLHKSLKFDRNQILNKYWDLADLDPRRPRETSWAS